MNWSVGPVAVNVLTMTRLGDEKLVKEVALMARI